MATPKFSFWIQWDLLRSHFLHNHTPGKKELLLVGTVLKPSCLALLKSEAQD